MSIGHVVNIAGGYLQSLITGAMSGSSSINTSSTKTPSTTTSVGNTQATSEASPFAQVLSSLQELEQSSFAKYQQVTQQVAGNLQTASQSATASGNTALAGQLNQLSTDFQNASTSGQLPNVRDLAQALGGGHHHHHHGAGSSSSSASGSSASSGTAGNLSEFIQSLNASQSGSSANGSLSALSIIDNTLSSAGIQIG
jgi:hypothetical protein